ncbi:MAG: 1,4-alpha-glucan branching protein GlgB [Planctomycetota bacterium]|nr:MAG: 1,4-alpha-glucan branching protein GlgB [Planctomycetota bacterium]REK29661.1 MAG: 1,4-alpha-glucan branching protein GlgB [Planctomycetota bacterium]REK30519.1 MAG: 1,4-alpha-glucan branching protein GlgB [Planctomycetota bacterium]
MSPRQATVSERPKPTRPAGALAIRNLSGIDAPGEYAALSRGLNCTMYRWMGAHVGHQEGVAGTRFAVWAPNAREVCVLNDRNGWRHGGFYLNSSDTGIWSGFVPEMGPGEAYKYSIRTPTGEVIEKADPYAFAAEHPPKTASIVHDLDQYAWDDAAWMEHRRNTNWFGEPISIYEVHLGSWRRPTDGRTYLSYRELADQLVDYVREMGYSHIQLMPITEYPFDGSWGYQATGYFAPTSRHGSPDEFRWFVDHCHQNGIGVLIDWVPAHFPTDAHALGRFDGTALFEHSDPRQGFHPDWNTFIYNFGRNEVRSFLLSSARFWCDQYHVDGLRVDAVASMLYLDYSRDSGEWVPNYHGGRENLEAIQFLKDLNTTIHGEYPGVLMVAEESTSWGGVSRPVYSGGLGFTMKWDMGWMNDTLHYMRREPIHRRHHQNELSFRMIYAFHENFVLPLSHDEVVHGKRALISQMPGDYWQKFANLRLLYGYQYTTPGKPLLFMGGEFGQWSEWNHDSQLDWSLLEFEKHDGLRRYVGDLNAVNRRERALHELDFESAGFSWIQADDADNSVYAFCRHGRDVNDVVVVVMNMTPVPRQSYRVGVPRGGFYREILNSDAQIYGGSNLGNVGGCASEPVPMHGRQHSVHVTLPPLAMLILKPDT